MKKNKCVLLINLGTPDSPSIPDVRKYLREFLMDPRVIDEPLWKRFPLVQFIIAPFRAPKSAKIYDQLWNARGSPLKYYLSDLAGHLQTTLGEEYFVHYAMRYKNPSMQNALDIIQKEPIDELIVIPLYPQYASASTGSTIEKLMNIINRWDVIPNIRIVSQFCSEDGFISTFAKIGQEYLSQKKYDHVLFSYHGLPERQILKASHSNYCQLSDKCCQSYNTHNQYCYRAQCYQTTRLLAAKCNLNDHEFTTCFQSRLGKSPWIKPYSDQVIVELARQKFKHVLVFSPSFVADCLETRIEIAVEYKELFVQNGGHSLDLVESLNCHPHWIKFLSEVINNSSQYKAISSL